MPASEKMFRFQGHLRNPFRSRNLRIENLNRIRAGVTLHEAKRHDNGLTRDLGLAEGRNTLFEHADNRESQFADPYVLSHRAEARKNRACEFLCYKAGLVVRLYISLVEVAAVYHQKMPYFLKAFGDCYKSHWTFDTAGDNGHLQVVRSCRFDYGRYFAACRLDIGQGNLVVQGCCLYTGSPQLCEDKV